jgi:hypothetical protein
MLPSTYQLPAGVVLIAVGLLACLAGYRLFRAVLTLYGFVLGALFASTLVAPSDITAMLVALAVGGVLGALAFYMGYFVGVILVGAGFGAMATQALWSQWRGEPGVIILILAAGVGAGLAVAWQRYVVVVATAFVGAQTALAGLAALLVRPPVRPLGLEHVWVGHLGIPRPGRAWAFVAWVALGALGTFVQLRSGGGGAKRGRGGKK